MLSTLQALIVSLASDFSGVEFTCYVKLCAVLCYASCVIVKLYVCTSTVKQTCTELQVIRPLVCMPEMLVADDCSMLSLWRSMVA